MHPKDSLGARVQIRRYPKDWARVLAKWFTLSRVLLPMSLTSYTNRSMQMARIGTRALLELRSRVLSPTRPNAVRSLCSATSRKIRRGHYAPLGSTRT